MKKLDSRATQHRGRAITIRGVRSEGSIFRIRWLSSPPLITTCVCPEAYGLALDVGSLSPGGEGKMRRYLHCLLPSPPGKNNVCLIINVYLNSVYIYLYIL